MRNNLETIRNVVIGTAGHIDHGKTTLVEKLTGINPDRLPEEKARGMTIDIGFSRFQLPDGMRVGVIDVPGHERFVKNMVAGATGIDLVLLVVAADDGVMPQTREHLEIMTLLEMKHGIIAVTKIDLVEPDLRDLVIEDIRGTVTGTFLADARVVPVSSHTGEGLDDLRQALHALIAGITPRDAGGVFRMPIQRVFSSKGFGTVLTGVPLSGQITLGDSLEAVPLGRIGRVRGIHAYGEATDLARAGHSSAINVTDIAYKEVHRGMVLAQPGYFQGTLMVEGRFHYLGRRSRPLPHLSAIRFHTGTAETLGKIHILEGKRIEPGEDVLVQFRFDEPVVVAPGDRYVVRLHSPMETIGGGEILDRSRWRLKSGKAFVIEALLRKEQAARSRKESILNFFAESGYGALSDKDLAVHSSLPREEAMEAIQEILASGDILPASRSGLFISRDRFHEAKEKARYLAAEFFRANPRRLLMEKTYLRGRLNAHEVFFHDLLAALEAEGVVATVRGENLRWAAHRPQLGPKEAQVHDHLLAALRSAPLSPPSPEEVAQADGLDLDLTRSMTRLLLEEGEAVEVAENVILSRDAIEEARRRLREHLEKEGALTASQAKTLLGSSRKYIIPLLEHLDREGFTLRRGDVRVLRSKGS